METSEGTTDVVHPEVRAHINSLVSALGGFSAEDDGRYSMGDSALEVLRDMKKWIRFYDEKTNRMDVARCMAEANLIEGDLLHILASWPEAATDNKFKSRAALACYELLVPLTWPMERNTEEMTVNHHRHLPVLQLAQVGYKRAIINFDAAQILHSAVRVALPSMALSRSDRSARDEGIIKLVLLFLRNIAMIAPPPGVKYDGEESQISRSALIDAFSYQDILLTILTVASNMGEDFNQEGIIIMEIIFHLVKRVDINKLFMDDRQLSKAKANELVSLMNKEAAMHRPHNRKAPTRHNRWGTMIWVQRDDGKMSTVTGQDALLDSATRQKKMDNSKTYRPPRRARKEEMEPKDLGPRVTLNTRAREQLRNFVEEFLDSGFNPLFLNVRKKLDESKDYVLGYHYRQFFYLTSWFLEAERTRQKATKGKTTSQSDVDSFNLVATVLNQEMFITLNRSMQESLDNKNWPELTAAMRCFTQILLTVQDMTETGNEADEEIAENILSRIFYEEETHERVAAVVKNFKDQGFEYLDACTELAHTYLRILETYSKQNVDMQVRSRKRVRRKKKAAKTAGADEDAPAEEEDDESDNDQAHAEKTSSERKFNFNKWADKFIPQPVVDTFVKFTRYYHDLNDAQLKRAHRYFYRIAFKQDWAVMLFRVDIIHLFYNMIKGPEPLDKGCSTYKEWDELVKQILKKCIRKIDERPALVIEMLFSKINATAHYLQFGFEKQTVSTSTPRAAAELEFRHIVEHERQVAIAVGVLLDKELAHHVKWVRGQLSAAESERRAWESAEKAMLPTEALKDGTTEIPAAAPPTREASVISVRPDDDARRTAMFKNPHLRLLMKLVGFERLAPTLDETPQSEWIIPPSLTADQLKESLGLINKAEFDPPTFEDGKLAEDQLRRKIVPRAPRKKAAFDDDEEGLEDDDEMLFPPNPRIRNADNNDVDKPKKIRRRTRETKELTEEEREERARKRREKEKEKARRFKSEVYVHASDDETDEEYDREFFAKEAKLREKQKSIAKHATTTVLPPSPKMPAAKRKAAALLESDGSSEDDDELVLTQDSVSTRNRDTVMVDEDESSDGTDNTPLSSSPRAGSTGSGQAKRRRLSKDTSPARVDAEPVVLNEELADADDEDIPVSKPAARRRPRAKAGFIIDSSDEE